MVKRTATVEVLDGDDTITPASDPLEGIDTITADEANQAFAITDELRGTAGITLQFTRVWPNNPGMVGHCGEMAAEEYSLAESARRYGPGRYVVRLRGPDNRYMKGGGKLNIAGNPTAAAPAAGNVGQSSEMVQLLEAMNRRQEDRERADAQRSEKFWALALAAIPTIPAIIAGLKGGGNDLTAALIAAMKPQPQMTPADMVGMLAQLKELNGGDKPDSIDQLSKLLTVAKSLSGNDGDSGTGANWMDLVRDGLKAAPDLIAGMQSRQPQTVTVHPADPASSAPAPQMIHNNPTGTDVPPEGADMWILIQPILRGYAANIELWAKEGKNPELRAEVLLDDLPGWLADRLKPAEALEMLNHAQWWEFLINFHPPLAKYREWVTEMRAALIELITEQLKESADLPDTQGSNDGK